MTVIHNAVSGKEGRSPIQVESPTTDDSQHWNYAKNRWMRAAHCNIWSPVDRPENSTLNYPSNAETQMTHNKREGNYATAEEETSLHSCIDARCFVSGAICCRAFSRQLLRWDIEQSGRVFSTLCQLERHGNQDHRKQLAEFADVPPTIVHRAWCMQLSRSGCQVKRQCVQKLWADPFSPSYHISDCYRYNETETHGQTMVHGKVAQEGSATAGALFIFPQPKSLHIIPPAASGV